MDCTGAGPDTRYIPGAGSRQRMHYTGGMSWAAAILLFCIALPVAARVLPWLLWIPVAPFLAAIWAWERFMKKPASGQWPDHLELYRPKRHR